MSKKNSNNYQQLKNAMKKEHMFKKNSAIKDFDNINNCIEKILKQSNNDPIVEIKSLICQFEGKLNLANYFAAVAIAYALLVGVASIIESVHVAYVILGTIPLVIVCALGIKNGDYKNTFILNALKFKLDELINNNERSKETGITQEIGITNEANISNETNIVNDPDETKKNKICTPYNFDEKMEYMIYNNIRERYNRKFLGKKTKVHKEYPDFDKYTEWEIYYKNKFLTEISDECEFKYYLNDRLRVYQSLADICKSVITPIYIAAITLVLTIFTDNGVLFRDLLSSLLVGIIIIMILLMCLVWEHGRKVSFFEDCINIIDSEKTSHQ